MAATLVITLIISSVMAMSLLIVTNLLVLPDKTGGSQLAFGEKRVPYKINKCHSNRHCKLWFKFNPYYSFITSSPNRNYEIENKHYTIIIRKTIKVIQQEILFHMTMIVLWFERNYVFSFVIYLLLLSALILNALAVIYTYICKWWKGKKW